MLTVCINLLRKKNIILYKIFSVKVRNARLCPAGHLSLVKSHYLLRVSPGRCGLDAVVFCHEDDHKDRSQGPDSAPETDDSSWTQTLVSSDAREGGSTENCCQIPAWYQRLCQRLCLRGIRNVTNTGSLQKTFVCWKLFSLLTFV